MLYTKAIVRTPGKNFSKGITSQDLGMPVYKLAVQQHEAYCHTLRDCGIDIHKLKAQEAFPDACFVEDTAIVTDKMAIVTRPGDPRRQGEEISIAETLTRFRSLERIEEPGTVDGGDILHVGKHFFIGLSERTNKEGARQLAKIFKQYGYTSSKVSVGSSLHLKSSVSCVGNNLIICTNEMAKHFVEYNTLIVSDQEDYACNCIWVNGIVIIPKGFPLLKNKLIRLKYEFIELDMTEFRKMDGGLSCLSLLF
jgi:dimethylargininase